MNWQRLIQQVPGRSEEQYKTEGFIGRRVGPGHLFLGGGRGYSKLLLHPVGVESTPGADHLLGADQEIPGWLIKITFLGKAEMQLSRVEG